jgi:hypothetical protein
MQLGKFVKQPTEYLGYDIMYSEFLDEGDFLLVVEDIRSDKYTSEEVDPEDLVVDSYYIRDEGTRIKVYLRNGVAGEGYKVTIRIRTNEGLVKEDEFKVKIKDY